MSSVCGALIRGTANLKIGIVTGSVAAISSLLFGYFLVSSYGLTGACLTLLVGLSLSTFTGFYLISKKLKIRFSFLPSKQDVVLVKNSVKLYKG
jgi:O-antigen/teichoic acid export membrane protein